MITIILDGIILVLFLGLVGFAILNRNRPQVGGKIGPVRTLEPPPALPAGLSGVTARVVTLYLGGDATPFATVKDYMREGPVPRPVLMRFYRVAGCRTEIEIPDEAPGYERIDAGEALALLRQLPDLRRVRRLHLSDERSFLDAWLRKERGNDSFLLGNATNFSLVVLYKPERRLGQNLGQTLLHEWLHLVAFASTLQLWRFKRAGAIEPLPRLSNEPLDLGNRNISVHEAWCELGELLFGFDEAAARKAAIALPLHAIILWRCVERLLRKTPQRFRSTRYDELTTRAAFMQAEIAPKARAVRRLSVR